MGNHLSNKNILIVDLGHLEVVSSFLLLYSKPNHHFFIITLPWLAIELEEAGFENIITYKTEYDDIDQIQLIKNISEQHKIDLIVLTTLENFIPEYDLMFSKTKIELWIYIHNANFWFKKRLGVLPRNTMHLRLLSLAKRADKLVVLDNNIKRFVETKFYVNKLIVIPTAISIFMPTHKDCNRIKILIPGNIQEKRRDYNLLIQLIPSINHLDIDLLLLGKIDGQYANCVLDKIKTFETENLKVYSFSSYIPQKTYDAELAMADIILAPIKKETDFFGVEEIYGTTKFSGIYADIIRHRKPFIAPSNVNIPEGYEVACSYYNNIDDLINIIKNCFLGNSLRTLKQNALSASTSFNIDVVKKNLYEIV